MTVAGDPPLQLSPSLTVTQTGRISDGASPGTMEVAGGGTLVLANAANSYSGGTVVTEFSTLSIAADGDLVAATGGLDLGRCRHRRHLRHVHAELGAQHPLGAGAGAVAASSGVTATLGGVISGDGPPVPAADPAR